ncbi:MAG: hypothetical protein LDL41_18860 [Coleofasciculus sp. S288]|nr:hypothetical protein [Coleofasciculus sp. S288]
MRKSFAIIDASFPQPIEQLLCELPFLLKDVSWSRKAIALLVIPVKPLPSNKVGMRI